MSWHHGDWLSFAQATASTIAIAGAFGVVFIQHHLENNRRRMAERADARRVLRIAIAFTSRAFVVVNNISVARSNEEWIEREDDRRKMQSDLNQMLEAMNGLPIHILPTAKAAEQVIRARSELAAACFEASKSRDTDGPGSPAYGAPWGKWGARLSDAAKILREEDNSFGDSVWYHR